MKRQLLSVLPAIAVILSMLPVQAMEAAEAAAVPELRVLSAENENVRLKKTREVRWIDGLDGYTDSNGDRASRFGELGDIVRIKSLTRRYVTILVAAVDSDVPGYYISDCFREVMARRDAAVAEIAGGIRDEPSRYRQIDHLNDWLTQHNEYNTDVANDAGDGLWDTHECMSALMGREGSEGPVCAGYAKAFKTLCDELAIPCVLVAGESHMWNYVQMEDGKWYAVDVTWNDPITRTTTGEMIKAGKKSGFENDA